MRSSIRFGVPALALAAAVLTYRAWPQRPAPVATEAQADERPDPVKAERDLLRGEVHRLSLEVATLQAHADGAAAPAAPRAEVAPPSPEQEMAWLGARARFLDDTLAKQPRDERWAQGVEAKARALYDKKVGKDGKAGPSLVNVACRTTACRMEFSYADGDARLNHLHTLDEAFPELPRVSYAYPGEPTVHTRAVVYVAMEDHPLPPFDYQTFVAAASE